MRPVTTIVQAPKFATPEGIRTCPGYAGGVEWNGPALDRLNNQLITGAVDACFIVKLGKTNYKAGEVDFGGTVEPDGPVTGWITAVDSETGAERWKYHAEKPVVAGITPTAGGVTIAGDLAGNLLVFNSKTGELVHKAQTRGAMAGGVVTYELSGRQYVAFANGNVSRNAFGALGVPSVVVMALNGRGGGVASSSTAAAVGPTSGRTGPGAAPTSTAGGAGAAGAAGAAGPATPNHANGRKLYNQVCVACHGPDGNLIADHKLGTLKSRRDAEDTVRYIKDPKAPMPKMFPDLIDEQAVIDVAAYVRDELAK